MTTKRFWLDLLERAVATAAQAGIPFAVLAGTSATVDWKAALYGTAGAAALSLLKSLAASQVGDNESASLVPEVSTGRHAAP